MKKTKVAKVAKVVAPVLPFKQYNMPYKWVTKKPLYIDKKDKRYKKYVEQLRQSGFSDTETWCLTSVIAQFVLPRLIRFKSAVNGYPMGLSIEKWYEMLDQMIFAFEWALAYDESENWELSDKAKKENWKRYKKGMKLFSENFMDLWW